MTKSEIFTKAHQIAKATRAAVGNYMIAFSLALKEVYSKMKEITVEALEALGGNRWTKSSMDRVYFNGETLAEIVGFSFSTYKTGNVSSASLGDKHLSNTRAERIRTTLFMCKFWFDVNDKKFHCKYFNEKEITFDYVVEAIKKAL
ncbi:hypothetical protein SJZ58_004354 [Salmonella enterica]|nr:hypothetical protein [Salmonella enterica]